MKKKYWWVTGIVIAAIAAGFIGYRVLAGNGSSNDESLQTATLERGSLSQTLGSSGNVRSGQSAVVSWQAAGKVGEVKYQAGDKVAEDEVLAELDPNTLSAEMIKARQTLIDAQQALDDLLNSKLQQAQALQSVEDAQDNLNNLKQNAAEELSQAQLDLAKAEDALADAQRTRNAMNYPHSTDKLVIEKAETDYLLAKADYKEALSEYHKYEKKNLTNRDRVRALNNLVAAKQKMESTLTIYNWYLLNYTDNEIAQADGEVAVAQANLDIARSKWESLNDGLSSAAIALAEAQLADATREWERVKDGPNPEDIAAAQAAVDAAQASLDNAQLKAPFAGTITEVDVKTGDLVKSGDNAYRIDDLDSVFVDLSVSEVDLPGMKTGQQAILEFDAIPDKQYTGEVTEIGMVGTVSQGVVNYPVVVRISDPDGDIRPGMTAAVTIIVAQTDDALLVPNRAIRTINGQQTVTVLYEGQQISVPITVGLVGDSMSEVTSDQLREGDTVVVNGSTTSASSSNSGDRREFFGPGMGGGSFVVPAP